MKKNIYLASAIIFIAALTIGSVLLVRHKKQLQRPLSALEKARPLIEKAMHAFNKQDYEQALIYYQEARAILPTAGLHYNIGLSYEKLRQFRNALTYYKEALTLDTTYVPAYIHTSYIYEKTLDCPRAKKLIQRALLLEPDNLAALLGKGRLLYKEGDLQAARYIAQKILAIDKENSAAYSLLGSTYEKENNMAQTLDAYTKSALYAPHDPVARVQLSIPYLGKGDYPGWSREHEWRWHYTTLTPYRPKLWNGSSLKGKKILLLSENGLGDMLQYVRFAQDLKKQGAHVILQTQKPLIDLYKNCCPYIDEIVSWAVRKDSPERQQTLASVDAISALMSLPYHFKTTIDTIPTDTYITPPTKLCNEWEKRLANDKNFKIGLCWLASTVDKQNVPQSKRTMPLELIAQLSKIPGISVYALQKEGTQKELESFGIQYLGDDFDTTNGAFMDTAALMKNLDLVVTIDTVTAHLAGALHVPVWVLLPVAADVRWLQDRTDTPWYPTMQLFRSPKTGDWVTPLNSIRTKLAQLTQQKRAMA